MADFPEFFQPFILDYQYRRLDIPAPLTQKLGGLMDNAKIRRCKTNVVWDVAVKYTTNKNGDPQHQITNGWSNVVINNNIQIGDFVVFKFYGNSVFGLTVFAHSGCERRFDHVGPPLDVPIRGRCPTWVVEEDEPSLAASCFANNSRFPSFIAKMNEGYLHTGAVTIPFHFARNHLNMNGDIPIVLRYNDNVYHVVAKMYKKHNGEAYVCKFKTGFGVFAHAIALSSRSVSVFELLPLDEDISMLVTKFG